jgi:hypothetical protein
MRRQQNRPFFPVQVSVSTYEEVSGVGDAYRYSASAARSMYRKITLRLIQFLFICYVAADMDRINVGFAQPRMKRDLGFSVALYGFGADIFSSRCSTTSC